MSGETRSIGAICADLKAKGEGEAAFVLDRVANANAELGETNIEMLETLELIATYPTEVDVVDVAEKAIAKAKGETE